MEGKRLTGRVRTEREREREPRGGSGWVGVDGGWEVNRAVRVGSRGRLAKGIIHFSPPFVWEAREGWQKASFTSTHLLYTGA